MARKLFSIAYSYIILFFIAFLIIAWYVLFIYESKKGSKQVRFKKPIPLITSIAKQFDPISKEHLELRKIAASSLDFPISYKHVETIYFRNDQRKEIMIKMRFTGRDTYNTERKSCMRATYTYHGEKISDPQLCDLRA